MKRYNCRESPAQSHAEDWLGNQQDTHKAFLWMHDPKIFSNTTKYSWRLQKPCQQRQPYWKSARGIWIYKRAEAEWGTETWVSSPQLHFGELISIWDQDSILEACGNIYKCLWWGSETETSKLIQTAINSILCLCITVLWPYASRKKTVTPYTKVYDK